MSLQKLLNLTHAEILVFPLNSEKSRDVLIRLPVVCVCMFPVALSWIIWSWSGRRMPVNAHPSNARHLG